MHLNAVGLARSVTEFGNLAVVAPTACVACVWLATRQGVAAARHFLLPVLVTFVATLSLKTVSRAMGWTFEGTPYALSNGAPSGHVSMSTVVYGGVALLLLRHSRGPAGPLAAALAALVLTAVAITRVMLHDHTPGDVAAGFLLSGACVAWMLRSVAVAPDQSIGRSAELLAVTAGTTALMFLSGLRFNSAAIL